MTQGVHAAVLGPVDPLPAGDKPVYPIHQGFSNFSVFKNNAGGRFLACFPRCSAFLPSKISNCNYMNELAGEMKQYSGGFSKKKKKSLKQWFSPRDVSLGELWINGLRGTHDFPEIECNFFVWM